MLAVRMVMVTLVLILAAVLVLALITRVTARGRSTWEEPAAPDRHPMAGPGGLG